MNVEIANKLVELRKKNGYSQESLAEKLGVSRQAVSKWERSEASPDTDNLILLARIYGISLDELFGLSATEPLKGESKQDSDNGSDGGTIHIGWDGIHVEEKGKNDVHVGWDGVHVKDDSIEVKVGGDGVSVKDKDGRYVAKIGGDPISDDQKSVKYRDFGGYYAIRNSKRNRYQRMPMFFLTITAFLLIGALFGVWHPTWMVFLLIPIVDTLITAIMMRDFRKFAYPILVVTIYLFLGFFFRMWHPWWVIFLTIPIYQAIIPKKESIKDTQAATELI